jgi:hypothetical protein
MSCGGQAKQPIVLVKEGHVAKLLVPDHTEVARRTLRSLIRSGNPTADELQRKL